MSAERERKAVFAILLALGGVLGLFCGTWFLTGGPDAAVCVCQFVALACFAGAGWMGYRAWRTS